MLINHRQPELAETFFNSVTTKILHRSYFNNHYIFARPAISTEFIDSYPPVYSTYPPVYSSYYPQDGGLRATAKRIIEDFDWQRPFADLDGDVDCIAHAALKHLGGQWPKMEVNCQIQVLYSAFYRNKTAYIIGKAINGYQEYPFALAVRHNRAGRLFIDTLILDPWRISVLFSLSRAYFMVDMEVPSGYVQFLRSIMPNKPRSELYTMLGLGKQGKTMFFRDLVSHLRHSNDQFIIAPGIPGLVMLVFTMPSYPYVFALLPVRVQDHQGRLRQLEEHGPGHGAAQVPDGEACRPGGAHGRHPGVLERGASAVALSPGSAGRAESFGTVVVRYRRRCGRDQALLHRAPHDAAEHLSRTIVGRGRRRGSPGVRQRHPRACDREHLSRRYVVEELCCGRTSA